MIEDSLLYLGVGSQKLQWHILNCRGKVWFILGPKCPWNVPCHNIRILSIHLLNSSHGLILFNRATHVHSQLVLRLSELGKVTLIYN